MAQHPNPFSFNLEDLDKSILRDDQLLAQQPALSASQAAPGPFNLEDLDASIARDDAKQQIDTPAMPPTSGGFNLEDLDASIARDDASIASRPAGQQQVIDACANN